MKNRIHPRCELDLSGLVELGRKRQGIRHRQMQGDLRAAIKKFGSGPMPPVPLVPSETEHSAADFNFERWRAAQDSKVAGWAIAAAVFMGGAVVLFFAWLAWR